MKKNPCINLNLCYTTIMEIEKTKSHLDQLLHEQNAVALLRDDLAFLIGWTKADHPAIAKRLEQCLANHDKKRKDLNA